MLRLAPVAMCLAACATGPTPRAIDFFTGPAVAVAHADGVVIAGRVVDNKTDDPVADAPVFVHCDCLAHPIELTTDADGIYRVVGLPSGKYTVQVLYAWANLHKSMYMPPHAMLRLDYDFDLTLLAWSCDIGGSASGRFTSAQPWVLMGNLDLPLEPPRPER